MTTTLFLDKALVLFQKATTNIYPKSIHHSIVQYIIYMNG